VPRSRTKQQGEMERKVDRAKVLYPDVWDRVRGACVIASDLINLDYHAALIVLAVMEGKQ